MRSRERATTWVQIVKAVLLMAGTTLLSILVMNAFGFSFARFFEAIRDAGYDVGSNRQSSPADGGDDAALHPGLECVRDSVDNFHRVNPGCWLRRGIKSSKQSC